MEKKVLRKEMRNKLLLLSREQYEEKSAKIANQLYQLPEWKQATKIGITISIFPEVNTYPIIEKAWSEGKKVACAKCVPETKGLDFYVVDNFSQVAKGFFGLYEPIVDQTTQMNINDLNLLIVPGVAFTKKGERLGVGGGYYDRLLPKYNGKTVSLAFDEQIKEELPIEPHDYRVQKVIGEGIVYNGG